MPAANRWHWIAAIGNALYRVQSTSISHQIPSYPGSYGLPFSSMEYSLPLLYSHPGNMEHGPRPHGRVFIMWWGEKCMSRSKKVRRTCKMQCMYKNEGANARNLQLPPLASSSYIAQPIFPFHHSYHYLHFSIKINHSFYFTFIC